MPVIAAVKGSQNGFEVRRIYCVGRNYLDHIREMKEADERDPPFFFQKPTDSFVPDGVTVPYPPATKDFQFEVELVVAIGKSGREIAVDAAKDHIFGYAIGLDMTRRDLQREARDRAWPWEMGKSFDYSAPCGPIHSSTSTPEIANGAISLSVNGSIKQKADISQMIWSVAEIIANLSKQYKLMPGDLIFTGTPAGVGPVVPGDRIECTIDGLGTFHVVIGPGEAA